jgi:hypothetical protein
MEQFESEIVEHQQRLHKQKKEFEKRKAKKEREESKKLEKERVKKEAKNEVNSKNEIKDQVEIFTKPVNTNNVEGDRTSVIEASPAAKKSELTVPSIDARDYQQAMTTQEKRKKLRRAETVAHLDFAAHASRERKEKRKRDKKEKALAAVAQDDSVVHKNTREEKRERPRRPLIRTTSVASLVTSYSPSASSSVVSSPRSSASLVDDSPSVSSSEVDPKKYKKLERKVSRTYVQTIKDIKLSAGDIKATLQQLAEDGVIEYRDENNTISATKRGDNKVHLTIHKHSLATEWFEKIDVKRDFIKFINEVKPQLLSGFRM